MVQSSLLSREEPLTSNIDKVIGVWIFRRRENTQNWQKLDFSFLIFVFFRHVAVARYVPELVFLELYIRNRPRWENKLWYKIDHGNVVKKSSNLVQPIS